MSIIKNIVTWWKHRAEVNETIKELTKLTDKELNDIGISRGEIRYIAETV